MDTHITYTYERYKRHSLIATTQPSKIKVKNRGEAAKQCISLQTYTVTGIAKTTTNLNPFFLYRLNKGVCIYLCRYTEYIQVSYIL